MAEKPGKAGVGSLGISLVSWMRQISIFSLSEFVDFGRQSVCIPLEDAEG